MKYQITHPSPFGGSSARAELWENVKGHPSDVFDWHVEGWETIPRLSTEDYIGLAADAHYSRTAITPEADFTLEGIEVVPVDMNAGTAEHIEAVLLHLIRNDRHELAKQLAAETVIVRGITVSDPNGVRSVFRGTGEYESESTVAFDDLYVPFHERQRSRRDAPPAPKKRCWFNRLWGKS